MSGLTVSFTRYVTAAMILILSMGVGSTLAVEDLFSVDLDSKGDVDKHPELLEQAYALGVRLATDVNGPTSRQAETDA